MDYQRDEHRVYRIVYHLVWTPKRRKAVLTGAIASECQQLIEATCTSAGWQILDLVVNPDHVHLVVQVWPSVSAADVVKECKATTSQKLRQKHSSLKKLPSLWTRSYFAATEGNISPDTIEHYVTEQKGR